MNAIRYRVMAGELAKEGKIDEANALRDYARLVALNTRDIAIVQLVHAAELAVPFLVRDTEIRRGLEAAIKKVAPDE